MLMRRVGTLQLVRGCSFEMLTQYRGKPFDVIVADPPYNSGGATLSAKQCSSELKYNRSRIKFDSFENDDKDQLAFIEWSASWLRKALPHCVPGATVLLFTDWRQLSATALYMQAAGCSFKGVIAWDKANARPVKNGYRQHCEFIVWGRYGSGGARDDVQYGAGAFRYPPPATSKRIHFTEKPVRLYVDLLRIFPRGARVLDPFMGSGVCGAACAELGLHYTGIEKSTPIFTKAHARLVESTATHRHAHRSPTQQTL